MSDFQLRVQGRRLPVTLLTGFLGSGKTTLLAKLLRQPAMARTAVIINELGETGLDHDLLRLGDEDGAVLLAAGCVCCAIRGDLADTLRDLFQQSVRGKIAEFDRVIIETTGLADPAPVAHTLLSDPMTAARYWLDGIITTVDAVNGEAELDAHPEAVKQAAIADRLILTKTDIASPEAIARIGARLALINPAAAPIRVVAGDIAADALLGIDARTRGAAWLAAESYSHPAHAHQGDDHRHHHHDDGIRAFAFGLDEPLDWDALAAALDDLAEAFGASLLRVKGILRVAGTEAPVVIHGVQHLFHPPAALDGWPSGKRMSRLVFITRLVPPDTILARLAETGAWRRLGEA